MQARYALTILNIAKMSDRETARRLIENLVRDHPISDVPQGLADLHWNAIEVFKDLVTSLRDGPRNAAHPWGAAVEAANRWLAMAE